MRRPVWGSLFLLAALPVGQATTTPQSVSSNPSAVARPQLVQAAGNLGAAGGTADSIMTLMNQYAKSNLKDVQAKQRAARADRALVTKENTAKLQAENKQIERSLDDAARKAETLMNAAETELRVGIASGAAAGGACALLASHLQSVEKLVRGLPPRPPTAGTSSQAAPNLDSAMNRFGQLQKRLAATSKRVDAELRKK